MKAGGKESRKLWRETRNAQEKGWKERKNVNQVEMKEGRNKRGWKKEGYRKRRKIRVEKEAMRKNRKENKSGKWRTEWQQKESSGRAQDVIISRSFETFFDPESSWSSNSLLVPQVRLSLQMSDSSSQLPLLSLPTPPELLLQSH